jgi:hypothetical protein
MGYKVIIENLYNFLYLDISNQTFKYTEGFQNDGYEFHRTRIGNVKMYTTPKTGLLSVLGNKSWYIVEVEITGGYAPLIMRWHNNIYAARVYNQMMEAKKGDLSFK